MGYVKTEGEDSSWKFRDLYPSRDKILTHLIEEHGQKDDDDLRRMPYSSLMGIHEEGSDEAHMASHFEHFNCEAGLCYEDDPEECPKRAPRHCYNCGKMTVAGEDFCTEYCAMRYASDNGLPYIDTGDNLPPGWDS